jgi:hypothetical protein
MSKTFVYESNKTFLNDVNGAAESLVTYVGMEQYENHPSEVEAEVVISDGQNSVRFGGYDFAGSGDGLEEFLHIIGKVRDGLTAVLEATEKARKDAADAKVAA